MTAHPGVPEVDRDAIAADLDACAGGVALGWGWADPVVGLVITAAILSVLVTASREVFRRLLDAVDPALVDRAEWALADVPGVLAVHRVRMRWVGHELQADVDLELDAGIPLSQAHAIAHRAEAALVRSVPRLSAAVVHAYPATALRSEAGAQA